MATGQKLLETFNLSYTTTPVDIATMTTLGTLTQEMNFIHVYDTSGSRAQLLDIDSKVLLNIPSGGLTTKEQLRLDSSDILFIKAVGQSMTSGVLVVSIYGG